MNAVAKPTTPIAPNASPKSIAERAINWEQVSQGLDAQGSAMVEHLLSPAECETLAALYSQDEIFRSRVVMERHGFGRGEYKYFSYPLPNLIAALRGTVYPHLVASANRWNSAMGITVQYPEQHTDFIERCHQGSKNLHLRCGDGSQGLPAIFERTLLLGYQQKGLK